MRGKDPILDTFFDNQSMECTITDSCHHHGKRDLDDHPQQQVLTSEADSAPSSQGKDHGEIRTNL